jgi:probable H4MPT-linked C1 transfer pathway protein
MTPSVLGLDIGGAHLKAAHTSGQVVVQPFELWKNTDQLPQALETLLRLFPRTDCLAVTMTGELCDCFETKRQGVHEILDAVAKAARDRPTSFWHTTKGTVDILQAREEPLGIAAANWHVLATFAGRYVPAGPGLLIDVGSTTTDIIPLMNGRPVPQGWTDPERLRSRELVYTGSSRTPLCALLGSAGAAELFATTRDVYLVLGIVAEDPKDVRTADGRPATRSAARARLARMLCADVETCSPNDIEGLARLLLHRQLEVIRNALYQVGLAEQKSAEPTIVLAGSGEFLARRALALPPALPSAEIISLTDKWGKSASQAACAYALCQLASAEEKAWRTSPKDGLTAKAAKAKGQMGADSLKPLSPSSRSPVVVKVGGSLFDLPDLGPRLAHWLAFQEPAPVLVLPGGGPTANVIRTLDRQQALGEEKAHWLALRALTLNAWLLCTLLPKGTAQVVRQIEDCFPLWEQGMVPIMDAHAFALADEGRPGCLPHSWSVTSDSLAARLAVVSGAAELILLKSVDLALQMNWADCSAGGVVDGHFPEAVIGMAKVRTVNFRQWENSSRTEG